MSVAEGGTHRTVLVPPPVPAAWSGISRGVLAATAAESVATWARLPSLGPAYPSALVVSRSTLETTLRFRPASGPIELRVPFEMVFADAGLRSNANGIPPPALAVAFGLGLAASFEVGDGAYVGALVDGMLLSTAAPFLAVAPDGGPPGSYRTGQDDLVLGLGRVAFVAGWHHEPWRLFGAVTLRNHPALRIEATGPDREETAAGINGGPAFLIWTLGVDVAVLPWLSLFLHVHEPLSAATAEFGYAPIVTGGLDAFVS